MNTLPLSARLYLIIVWGTAATLMGLVLIWSGNWLDQTPLLLLCLFVYGLADYFGVDFEIDDDNEVIMTVADAPMTFMVAISGPIGVVVIALGTLIVDAIRGCAWYRNLFNVSMRSITYLVMTLVYSSISVPGGLPFSGLRGLVALVAVGTVYYTLNTLFVSTIIALATHQSLLHIYTASLRTVNWVHSITTSLGAVLAALWRIDVWLVLPGIMPLIMAQRSFAAVAAWQSESRRSKALARESQQLAGKLERLQDTTTAMMASLEPEPLLETVSTRLAVLLGASASWVVLLDQAKPRLVVVNTPSPEAAWGVAAYVADLPHQGVRQIEAAHIQRLHPAAPWQTLVLIPLALESRTLGVICLAAEQSITLSEDDRRVLLAFAAQAALAMEHAQLFTELQHKQDELVRSSKLAALGTFSAGIGHEFNNLLAGILGFAQLGLYSDDVAEKDEALEMAVRACMRGSSITAGLLTFARRDGQQRSVHLLNDVVQATLVMVERELAKLNITVERHFQPVSPTLCDHGQLSQVTLNLITNARDAMLAQGGGVLTVSLEQSDCWIDLAVSDTGSGIPEALLDQVFQPFMTTKGALGGSETPGTGLGLAICHGIIQGHGGTINIKSVVGSGTTVTVRLPIVNDLPADDHEQLVSEPLVSLRILVVDDDAAVSESLARLLQSHGHAVTIAADGEIALRLYREQHFDFVCSDIVMPKMHGSELIRRLRMIDPQVQVLVMTGQAVSEQVDQALHDGAIGILRKPFEIDDLLRALVRYGSTRTVNS